MTTTTQLPADRMEIEVTERGYDQFQVRLNGVPQSLAIELVKMFCQAAGMPPRSAPPLIVEVLDPESPLQQCSYDCPLPGARVQS
jgi:hypothetical protein